LRSNGTIDGTIGSPRVSVLAVGASVAAAVAETVPST
jgi:hypothetical protein